MDLNSILWYFIGNGLVIAFSLICWNKIEPIKKNTFSILCLWFLLSILITLINCIFVNPYRIIINIFILVLINYFIFTRKVKNAIILVAISQTIISISEFSYAIIASLFYKGDIQEVAKIPIIFASINLYVSLVSLGIHKLGFTKLIYNLLIPQKSKKDNKDSVFYSIFMIIIVAIATMETYMELSFTIVVITNSIMAIIFIGIVIMSKRLEDKYEKISHKYETSISSLKEYEVMIDKFRVDTHENKNEFITIRNMLKDKNKKEDVVKYIDKLIDNKIKDNDKIMKKTAKIPEGGLRATIYSKLCLMDKLKIKYNLNISREVRTTDLIKLDEDLVLKICKILGVFLDNAVEAVKALKKKEISIDVYTLDGKLCIDITNNFKGNLDLDKISNAKYTTKGDGHGYGLTLVNNLLEEEPNRLENEKSINRDTFTQTLKIKM